MCVCGCAREKRAHLKVTAHSYRAYSGMFTSASVRGLKESALIETTGTAYTAP